MKKIALSLFLFSNLSAYTTQEFDGILKNSQELLNSIPDNITNFSYAKVFCDDNLCKVDDLNIYISLKDLPVKTNINIENINNMQFKLINEPKNYKNLYEFLKEAFENNFSIQLEFNDVKHQDYFYNFLKSLSFPDKDEYSQLARSYINFALNNTVSTTKIKINFKDNLIQIALTSTAKEANFNVKINLILNKHEELRDYAYNDISSLGMIFPYLNFDNINIKLTLNTNYFKDLLVVKNSVNQIPQLYKNYLEQNYGIYFSDEDYNKMQQELQNSLNNGEIELMFMSNPDSKIPLLNFNKIVEQLLLNFSINKTNFNFSN